MHSPNIVPKITVAALALLDGSSNSASNLACLALGRVWEVDAVEFLVVVPA